MQLVVTKYAEPLGRNLCVALDREPTDILSIFPTELVGIRGMKMDFNRNALVATCAVVVSASCVN